MKFETPAPNPAIANPDLTRPDWTTITSRPEGALRLDKNENIDPTLSEIVRSVMNDMDAEPINSYPDLAGTYSKLAQKLGIEPRQLLFGAGSDGVIRATYETFISPGDVVLHTDPTFAMYYVYSKMYGAEQVLASYEPGDNGPELTAEHLIDTIRNTRARLVCLPNPGSPTGTVFAPGEMREIIEAAGEAGSVILIDEAYHPFYPETVLPWISEYGHLVVTQTFAKSWGMAGFRIGYSAACYELISLMHKVRPMYEVNTFGLMVIEKMLDYWDEMMASVRRLEDGKKYFMSSMNELGLRTYPSFGNFFHVAFGDKADAVHAALEGNVLYRQDFGHPSLKGFSRFSSARREDLEPIVDIIRKVYGN